MKIIELSAIALVTNLLLLAPGLALARVRLDPPVLPTEPFPPPPKYNVKTSVNQFPGVPYTPPGFWHPPHHPPLPKHDAKVSVNQLSGLPFPPQELWLMRPPPPKQVVKTATNQYPGVPYTPPGFWHPPPAPK